jgi:hypothetical protein
LRPVLRRGVVDQMDVAAYRPGADRTCPGAVVVSRPPGTVVTRELVPSKRTDAEWWGAHVDVSTLGRLGWMNTVIDRCQPTRSAITVVGIDGQSASNARICGSTASTIDGLTGREYDGGPSAANARRTVFRPTPSLRTIALIGIPSAR